MKVPSLNSVESIGVIILAGVAAYAAYRAYKTGAGIASTVSDTVVNAKDAVLGAVHSVELGATSVGARFRALGNDAPAVGDNQTTAENARLIRQNESIAGSLPIKTEPTYDPMGNYTGDVEVLSFGNDSRVINESQLYSPDAMGTA